MERPKRSGWRCLVAIGYNGLHGLCFLYARASTSVPCFTFHIYTIYTYPVLLCSVLH